jgi:hypothetical protein
VEQCFAYIQQETQLMSNFMYYHYPYSCAAQPTNPQLKEASTFVLLAAAVAALVPL